MPTYEYRCKACGQHLEVVQAFTDDPLTTCEECGGVLRKVFGNVGISFKGSGFYKTDSRSGSATNGAAKSGDKGDKAAESTSSSDSSSTGSSSTKADSAGTKADSGSTKGSGSSTSTTTPSPTT